MVTVRRQVHLPQAQRGLDSHLQITREERHEKSAVLEEMSVLCEKVRCNALACGYLLLSSIGLM